MVGIGGLVRNTHRKKCNHRRDKVQSGVGRFREDAQAARGDADHNLQRCDRDRSENGIAGDRTLFRAHGGRRILHRRFRHCRRLSPLAPDCANVHPWTSQLLRGGHPSYVCYDFGTLSKIGGGNPIHAQFSARSCAACHGGLFSVRPGAGSAGSASTEASPAGRIGRARRRAAYRRPCTCKQPAARHASHHDSRHVRRRAGWDGLLFR